MDERQYKQREIKPPWGMRHLFYVFIFIFVLWVIGGWDFIATLAFLGLIALITYITIKIFREEEKDYHRRKNG